MPLVLGIHMDPKLLETEVGMVLDLDPPEIQAPVTLSESQGTKILVSKISSQHLEMMLFYIFFRICYSKNDQKCQKQPNFTVLLCTGKYVENDHFSSFLSIFCITNPQNA